MYPAKLETVPHNLHLQLVEVITLSKKSFVAMGKILRELKNKDLFRLAIGKGIESWEDYLRQPEIGLAAGEANRLIQIYEEFVVRLGYDEETISDVPVKNMHYLLPLVKKIENKEDADELVADATLLSQKDFKERIYDIKALELGEEATRTHEYFIMDKIIETSTMNKVPGIDSDLIKRTFNLE